MAGVVIEENVIAELDVEVEFVDDSVGWKLPAVAAIDPSVAFPTPMLPMLPMPEVTLDATGERRRSGVLKASGRGLNSAPELEPE